MPHERSVPWITLITEPATVRNVSINLSGCNSNCKACLSLSKHVVGKRFSVGGLLKLFLKSCEMFNDGIIENVVVTGGEPTLDPNFLTSLISELKAHGVRRVMVKTNCFLLNGGLLEELERVGLDFVSVDLKAYTPGIHMWYTGRGNAGVLKAIELLHDHGFEFLVETVFIPGVVDLDEIERIARHLGDINREIPYRINEFAPEHPWVINEFVPNHSNFEVSRRPTREEMLEALHKAERFLGNVIVGRSCIYNPYLRQKVCNFYLNVCSTRGGKSFKVYSDEFVRKYLQRCGQTCGQEGWEIHYVDMDRVLRISSG